MIVPEGGNTAVIDKSGSRKGVGKSFGSLEFLRRECSDTARIKFTIHNLGPPVAPVCVGTKPREEAAHLKLIKR